MPTASFDVFDTLLTRIWAEPRDLFVALGRVLQAQGLLCMAPDQFAVHRQESEKSARARMPSREVTLQDIYAELAARVDWTEAQYIQASLEEISLERAGIRPVPSRQAEVREARRCCGRVVFLSDMYLPATVVREWLTQAGYYQAGDEVLISGEAGVGKGRGGLFQFARKRLHADFTDWIHSGDQSVPDADAPKKLGITVRLDQNVHLTGHERILRGSELFAPEWRSLIAGAARLARLEAQPGLSARQRALWETGATVAGPLFWGFTKWCLQEARQRGLDELYFFARGGQIFWRIASQLSDAAAIRCHYLHTSRLAFAGTFDTGDPVRLRQLAAPSLAHHSVRQALSNLGLDENALELPLRWPRPKWEENLSPAGRQALADWLLAPDRLPLIRQALRERATLAREYLRQSGLGPGIRAGVVDTGWMGTIQKNMEHLLGDAAGSATLPGFYLGLSPAPEFACRGGCFAYTNTFRRLSLRRETTHLILLEIMARGTHGPLLGFDGSGVRVEPRFGSLPDAEREEVELFQSAVLAFVRHVEETAAASAPPAATAHVLIDNYLGLFHHPNLAEVRALGTIPHADQMLEQRHRTLCHEMSLSELLYAIVSFSHRPPGWWLAGQARLGHAPLLKGYMLAKKIKWTIQAALTQTLD